MWARRSESGLLLQSRSLSCRSAVGVAVDEARAGLDGPVRSVPGQGYGPRGLSVRQ